MKKLLCKCASITRDFIKNNPHVWWALFAPVFVAAFLLAERFIVYSDYWVSYIPLDDKIPFVPQFVVFYYLWFPTLFFPGLNMMLRDGPAFRRYILTLCIGFVGTLAFCIVFPNGQDLRPAALESGFFHELVRGIYSADTNTNVLPSMHVLGVIAVLAGIIDSKTTRKWWIIAGMSVLTSLICSSTVLIKQHSILDVFAGIAYGLVVVSIVYALAPFIARRVRAGKAGRASGGKE
ncbi:MAG: hypothetical protein LBC78_05290 [Oscillospiraceae bacterium]|jgi:membrane-associated phospholipid phosphatase|nr:hypothetical protein [Oscillospiraceae bacterium]